MIFTSTIFTCIILYLHYEYFLSGELVQPAEGPSLVMSLDEMEIGEESVKKDMFSAAVDAMTVHGVVYGYPTLLCGNLVTSIDPVSTKTCPINQGSASEFTYKCALRTCEENFIDSQTTEFDSFKRLLIGKMNDKDGWYLPYIYLDGYIDRHGKTSLKQAVNELENGEVDDDLCKELNRFIDLCKTTGTNKNECKSGSVSSSAAQESVVNRESVLMFSYSEKLAEVLKRCNHDSSRQPQALASVSLGEENILLQFTDGLVVSRERWEAHSKDERNAIKKFVKFFTSPTFRYKLAYGFDLNVPQVRYLLIPNKDFYKMPFPAAYDPIYRDASKFLNNAVPAPALRNKSSIQSLLSNKCLKPDLHGKRDMPSRKSEL